MPVPHPRLLLVAGVLAVLAAACGGEGTDTGPVATTAPAEATVPEVTTSPSLPGAHTILVEVADGQVVGGPQRLEVPVGEEVEILVMSDVADEVHVHGYDLHEDVPAGGGATVGFTADIPGVFEVELEERGLQLLTLEVG